MTLFQGDKGPARVKLVVAYDGTDFHGWADQSDVRTVEGVLTKVLERFLRHPVERLSCAGRTDAGVHAWGQVVSFDADPGLDPWRLQSAVNGALAPEVVVREAELVEPGFDARRSACWRAYRYAVVNRPVPDPFLARFAWWVPTPLDVRALRLVLPPGTGRVDDGAARPRIALARSGERRAALRRPRHCVLLADGAVDRGDARRRRDGQEAARRSHGHPPVEGPLERR